MCTFTVHFTDQTSTEGGEEIIALQYSQGQSVSLLLLCMRTWTSRGEWSTSLHPSLLLLDARHLAASHSGHQSFSTITDHSLYCEPKRLREPKRLWAQTTVSPNDSFHSCVTAQPKELMKDGVMCDAQVGVGLAVQINRSQDFSTGLWSLVRKRINHLISSLAVFHGMPKIIHSLKRIRLFVLFFFFSAWLFLRWALWSMPG